MPHHGPEIYQEDAEFRDDLPLPYLFADADGQRGSVVTFLEFNDVPKALPGKGNHFAAILRVKSNEALDYWMDRLTQNEVFSELIRLNPTQPRRLLFQDPEGHNVELMVSDAKDAPMAFPASDIPAEFRVTGIEGIRSCATLDQLAPIASIWAGCATTPSAASS